MVTEIEPTHLTGISVNWADVSARSPGQLQTNMAGKVEQIVRTLIDHRGTLSKSMS